LSAADRRNIQLSTYFGSLQQIPIEISWKKLRIRIMTGDVAPSQFMYALNGTIVGLAKDSNHYEYESEATVLFKIRIFDRQKSFIKENDLPMILPSTPVCDCVGLGIRFTK
jgi:hypothetical protein